MVPQRPPEAAWYTYGTPMHGAAQYAHPKLMSLLCMMELAWGEIDDRRFGVGNTSLAGGAAFKKSEHQGHRSGLDVDIRPLRIDGQEIAVTRMDKTYDHDGTKKLIELFFESNIIQEIFFNDMSIPRVKSLTGHDNHFHVTVKWGATV
jgi:penicillin-insensitive murein endopeptidase